MPDFAPGISDQLSRRPALLALAGLVAGLTVAHFPLNWLFVVALLALVRRVTPLVSFAIGLVLGVVMAPPIQPPALVNRSTINADFVVDSVPIPMKSGGVSFLATGDMGRVTALCKEAVRLGDTVEMEGVGSPLAPDRVNDYLSRGLVGSVKASMVNVLDRPVGISAMGAAWRSSFVTFCDLHLPPRSAAFVAALVFEQRSGLDDSTKQDLEQSGAVQIVSASGLHLFVLAWFLEMLLGWLPLPYLVRQAIVILILGAYAGAGGFAPGACRALAASILRAVGFLFKREFDALSSIGIFGLCYLIWRPYGVFDAGFQVTSLLGVGLAIFATQTGEEAISQVLATIVGWVTSLPLLANLFGSVSFLGLPVSFVSVVLLPVCMIGLLLAHAVSFISPALSDGMLLPVGWLADILSSVIHFAGSARWWGLRLPEFGGYWVALFYCCGLLLWTPRARPAS
jgi:competence protein ComEC